MLFLYGHRRMEVLKTCEVMELKTKRERTVWPNKDTLPPCVSALSYLIPSGRKHQSQAIADSRDSTQLWYGHVEHKERETELKKNNGSQKQNKKRLIALHTHDTFSPFFFRVSRNANILKYL